jgi:hypothetical protein
MSTPSDQPATPLIRHVAAGKSALLQQQPQCTPHLSTGPLGRAALQAVRAVAETVLHSMYGWQCLLGSGQRELSAAQWQAYARSHQPALNDLGLVLLMHLAWVVQQQRSKQHLIAASGSSNSSNSSSKGQGQESIPAWHEQFLAAEGVAPWDPAWNVTPSAITQTDDELDSVISNSLAAIYFLVDLDSACKERQPCHYR